MDLSKMAQLWELRKAVCFGWTHGRSGKEATYGCLLRRAVDLSRRIRPGTGGEPARVAILLRPGPEYVIATFAAWMKGACVVPLALSHPLEELAYVHLDSSITQTIVGKEYHERVKPLEEALGTGILCLDDTEQETLENKGIGQKDEGILKELKKNSPSTSRPDQDALVIYTSGTTGRPKGAVHTHRSIGAMIDSLVTSWKWESNDRILNTLPLHHIHGIVNALYCPLSAGACVEFFPKFNATQVWERLMDVQAPRISVFMGVPTMYHLLIAAFDGFDAEQKKAASTAVENLRLMVSGSAACPLPILKRWEQISGHVLLERYGMTEIGMALSNPLIGERRQGTVGLPLPGVELRVATESGEILEHPTMESGELLVRSPTMFREYLGKPEETRKAFTSDGWFKTGDEASMDADGYWRILGRKSADIIKQGGYKISANEIESKLLEHPNIKEVAVVGLPDEAYGQTVAAILSMSSLGDDETSTCKSLREWCASKLAPYKIPRKWHFVRQIPRNAMGKINKKELLELFK